MGYINFAKANCKNCYKCIRVCPVKAIKINNDQAEIVEELCIACGQCLLNCPQNAKTIKSDRPLVESFIKNGYLTAVSLAPSFAGLFNFSPLKLITALKKLGFNWVGETSVGADIIAKSYEKIYNSSEWDIAITTACPSVNLYFQKYHPDLLKYLIPVASPMIAHGRYIKELLGKDTKVIFIGPCLAKKVEANDAGSIDAVLSFEDLLTWICDEKIDVENLDESPLDNYSTPVASNYPIRGLSYNTIKNKSKKRQHITVSGIDQINQLIQAIKTGQLSNCWIEATACKESCIEGPGMPKNSNVIMVEERIRNYAKNKRIYKDVKEYTTKVFQHYPRIKLNLTIPSEEEIRSILKKIGKNTEKEELNCGACGYNSCKEKAIAVYNGIANLYMCLPYMRSKAESLAETVLKTTPNGIIVADENLDILEMNKAALQMFYLNENKIKGLNISNIMDADYYLQVLKSNKNIKEKIIHLPNYDIIVKLSIYYLKDEHLLIGIYTDITEKINEEKANIELKKKTAEMAQKVILKQMTIAQEIASLLGETTAETRAMLTKLIDLLQGSDDVI